MPRRLTLMLPALLLLGACASTDKEMVASEDTLQCQMQGKPFVVRFVDQEARLLIQPNSERINLYQIGSGAGGVRYSNGVIELRGSGTQLTFVRDGTAIQLTGCEPLMVPKHSGVTSF
jgi:membrane-bound inhibitor of C-type lysozyme